MNIAMFKEALTTVVSSEFADVPNDNSQIDIQPSKKFQKKMKKLIKNEQRTIWHYTNTTYKRAAILVAVLVIMFTTACSVSAIREPIVKFFTEAYETFIGYFFEGDTVDNITTEYEIGSLPDDFELKETYSDDTAISKSYENKKGDLIVFSQRITSDTDFRLDAENGSFKEFKIDDIDIHMYLQENLTKAIWVCDGYLMNLTYHGKISEHEMTELILSVNIKNK